MYPVLLQVGPLTIYSYGVMMALAFLVAGWVVSKEFRRLEYDPNFASSLVMWAALGGLLGARILFILQHMREFLSSPWSFVFTGAGFVWYGGLMGGVGAVTWYIFRQGLPWPVIMDCIAPAIALGHGIGRIGCQLAGDGDWGPPTTLPWGMTYPRAIVGWDPDLGPVHPTPIYETLTYTAIFALLWSIRKKEHQPGSLFWGYCLLAGVARFFLEFVRVNPPLLWGLSQGQLISIVVTAVGMGMLWRGRGQQVRLSPGLKLERGRRS